MPMSNEMGVHPALVTALLGLCAALGAVGCGSTSKADLVATNGVTGSGGDGASNSSTTEAATSAAGTTSVKGASGTNGASNANGTSSTSSAAASGEGGTGAGGTSGSSGGANGGQGGSGPVGSSGLSGAGGANDDCNCAQGDLQCALRCAGSSGMNSGDCKDDADCDGGGTCVELSPGGYRVCAREPAEFTACDQGVVYSCCGNADCEEAAAH